MMKEMKLSIVDANDYFVRAVSSYSGFLLPYCSFMDILMTSSFQKAPPG